ncbi:hypothetical protein [Streptomyces tremellae]|uniref:ATP/GTP-binding protein n=1 Tax=Streptomyces tremellae TaxID=1124239 RepID=A0ABP7G422_9ACTN
MIRLPSSHAAITAPLVASNTAFPGIPIGRSLLDGRQFFLSPVLVDAALMPSTTSIALGGLGSGKSATAKVRIRREILDHQHQAVVIDSFGEDVSGEWAPLVRSLGGRVIQAGDFSLNPCSELFPPAVREQLVRSLILAVEPGALNPQVTHALQHALGHPKATSLNGLVGALVCPQDGRWPAARLTEWGEPAALALSRYTEGALTGLFDGQDASLPETDLPILSFDFTGLDRSSPAIPSLMAAISCWAEHVWLPQSTAVHRHLVIEEAWQILLSPATAELIQRLLKNSRKAGLSLEAVMHTLSDLGDGRARDLARLCEVAHVGRLSPEEADLVGALLGLPDWAIAMIPGLAPGQAVWKVGAGYVDVVETVLTTDEAVLTDTSSRRRNAQQTLTQDQSTQGAATGTDEDGVPADQAVAIEQETPQYDDDFAENELPDDDELLEAGEEPVLEDGADDAEDWGWEMPPNVIDLDIDVRHEHAVQAAIAGRYNEAAQLAALGEREDIAAHGVNSPQAAAWLSTRARIADACGRPDQAAHLRATVANMQRQEEPLQAVVGGFTAEQSAPSWDRKLPALCLVAGTAAPRDQEREARVRAYKGRAGAVLHVDGVHAYAVAQWSADRDRVTLELRSYSDRNARYLYIESAGHSASSTRKDGWYPDTPEITLPVSDPLADITVTAAVGGVSWHDGAPPIVRTVRLSPTGTAYDAKTGRQIPTDL